MPQPQLDVLFEDNHLLVINKPAGLATQGVVEGAPSVVTEAKAYVKSKYRKPGNVYLGVVSRLDASVSGVIVLARTSKAAARLNEQFRERTAKKIYWAIVDAPPDPPVGELSDWLKKDEKRQRMAVVSRHTIGAQRASLAYSTVNTRKGVCLLQIELHTGRKHQIRVQLAHLGCPILGDHKYGSRRKLATGIALHAHLLEISHPVTKEAMRFAAPLPESLARLVNVDTG